MNQIQNKQNVAKGKQRGFGKFVKIFEKVQSGSTRIIPSMAEINECFP
jgi:hypothetical protein